LSGLVKVKTGTQDAWRPKNVFHYMQWNNDAPDFVVDVSGFMEPKKKAILAYGSQFFDPKSTEPTTPISTQGFLDNVFHRASDLGRLIGVAHAEGFTSQKMIGVNRLDLMI
jgi:LmbE family N-acetylglucosaminyl deacetylase